MNWTDLIKDEMADAYAATEGLMAMAEGLDLNWKPAGENNWMTTGQLLLHVSHACGQPMGGFITGDWGLPDGMKLEDMDPAEMMPPAEKMRTVQSVQEARDLLAADKKKADEVLEQAGEDRLANEPCPAPWDPRPWVLGRRCLNMVAHLTTHKAQLFYYLKLQGRPVNTHHLWAAAE